MFQVQTIPVKLQFQASWANRWKEIVRDRSLFLSVGIDNWFYFAFSVPGSNSDHRIQHTVLLDNMLLTFRLRWIHFGYCFFGCFRIIRLIFLWCIKPPFWIEFSLAILFNTLIKVTIDKKFTLLKKCENFRKVSR